MPSSEPPVQHHPLQDGETKLTIRQRRSKHSDLSIITNPASARKDKKHHQQQPSQQPPQQKAEEAENVIDRVKQKEIFLRRKEFHARVAHLDPNVVDLTRPGPLTSRMLAWDGVPFVPLILDRKILTTPSQQISHRNAFLPHPHSRCALLRTPRQLLLRIFSYLSEADGICFALTCKPLANLSRRLNGGQGIYYTPAGKLHLLMRLNTEMKRKGKRLCMGQGCERYYAIRQDEWWWADGEDDGRKKMKGRYGWRGMRCPKCVKREEEAQEGEKKEKGRKYLCF